ncbi:MAG: SagB family peptide dehydrogenase [Actinomycetota bacterium]|nr:SagB family peptide dehydrogenase [Actinomycetota bacterium]
MGIGTSGGGVAARRFHEATKHSPESVRSGGHRLDWRNKPNPFKVYDERQVVELPRPVAVPGVTAMEALERMPSAETATPLDIRGLARLLTFGAGVLRRLTYEDGETFHFRTYASAGALYPVEIYVVNDAIDGVDAGIYHFDPLGYRLIRLRAGDHRGLVAESAGREEAVMTSPVMFVLTGIPWRTAWKYTERGYRHLYWDAGMILANVLALAASSAWPARVVLGFVDSDLCALLGIDGKREFPLCVVTLGSGAPAAPPGETVTRTSLPTLPLSRREMEFDAIEDVNEASSLATTDELRTWRSRFAGAIQERERDPPKASAGEGAGPEDLLEEVIRRRGSARFFGRAAMPVAALRRTLHAATQPIMSDYAPRGSRLVEPYLIANTVDGLPSGAHVYRDGDFVLLREGNFRREAGHLCLEQRLGADAAATMFLMTDLDLVLSSAGDRGYRVAQLEGGIVGGRIYLGAYADRFGATGLTFYDDLVTEFFSPDAAGKSCVLVVAVGESPRLTRRTR